MADNTLTDEQISLLFDIGTEEPEDFEKRKSDVDLLLALGFIEPSGDVPGLCPYRLTAKGEKVIEERGGGPNEA